MRFVVLVEGGEVEVCFEEFTPAERGFAGVDAEFADVDFGFVVFWGDLGGEYGSLFVRGCFIGGSIGLAYCHHWHPESQPKSPP